MDKKIVINNITRHYFIISSIQKSQNILLCFPGGSETIKKFLSFTNIDLIDNNNTTIIVFEGQPANNTYAWQNAFVWLKNNFQNDVLFIDTVLRYEKLISNNINIFLTGKSDGSGFCMLYSNLSSFSNYIKGIFACSGAYFGLNQLDNISPFDIKNTITINSSDNKNTIYVPKNIIIPKNNISITIMHGTADQVMPFNGKNYTNVNAYRDNSIWNKIDNILSKQNNIVTSNTYTANIESFAKAIVDFNNLKLYKTNHRSDKYSIDSYRKSLTNFNLIKINFQNHDWSGHDNSGPNSNDSQNKYLDATYLLSKFFNLDLKKDYKLIYKDIPDGFLKYNASIQNFQNLPITTSSNLIQNYESFQNTNEYNYNLIIFWLIIIIIILLLLKLRNKKVILLK